ncbi:hypothetical protein EI74_0491 [Mycoplasma testudineum]|uniref:Lipoprotein-associated protein n=1 Tax=Mycoplasma testudineum TaxID=244584 RepID=A0A4R6IDR9_9MOLU|nr:hypothetical protein [Mycoplasma testudineum]OYD26878.1 hypothetical protein CG473_02075 [Mycoplasma testudineum]TDO20413.1 hypothetical protein EI74_0491 [Mycoplasma testudineum]
MKKWKLGLGLSVPLITAVAAVSCGTVINSPERQSQETEIGSNATKETLTKIYNQSILGSLYGVDLVNLANDSYFNDPASEFYKDVEAAWNFYYAAETLNNINWFNEQLETWKTNSFTSYVFNSKNESIIVTTPTNSDTWKTLFLNFQSPIRTVIVNMLLVKKYLLEQSLDNVKKTLTTYDTILSDTTPETDTTKILYKSITADDGMFFFTKYLVNDKKIVNKWSYTGTPTLAQANSGILTTVNSVDTYNALVTNAANQIKTMSNGLSVSGSSTDALQNLYSYTGIAEQTSPSPTGDLSWAIADLKLQTEIKEGFQDINTNLLYSEQKLSQNAASTNSNSDLTTEVIVMSEKDGTYSLNANYLIKITPNFDTDSEKFTWATTPWNTSDSRRTIAFWLNRIDTTLIATARTHYRALGFEMESQNRSADGHITNGSV